MMTVRFNDDVLGVEISQCLASAVRIPTVVTDNMGLVGEDERWEIFYDFAGFLRKTFPMVHRKLSLTTISEHGLLYTWTGSDVGLKPLLLMAHSDVVPVDQSSEESWTYPAFDGHLDGTHVWGRGSEDDKSNLIAMLFVLETLLSEGFQPTRTIILSVGFDEEGGADQSYGARCLAEELTRRYGKDGIEAIFDEGIAGVEEHYGSLFALPATAEKGYVDVVIKVETLGGHSSYPPDHTAIGFLSQAIGLVEHNPFSPHLQSSNPFMTYLVRAAEHAKSMPEDLRSAILSWKHGGDSTQLEAYLCEKIETKALIQTTLAVDMISGGTKANSLPEEATALVNHRVAFHDSLDGVAKHYHTILEPWAKARDLSLQIPGRNIPAPSRPTAGRVHLTFEYAVEPSPISPVDDDARFEVLDRTLRTVFGDEIIVAPTILSGNTDTRYFWDLSTHIYRMSPWKASHDPRGTRMHTVDERMPVKGLVEMFHFYHEFVLNMDKHRG